MPENKEIRSATITELRVHDDSAGPVIAGYAAVFNELSEDLGGFKERVLPSAFTNTLKGKPDVKALVDHDSSKILGRTTAGTLMLTVDDRGLAVRIKPPDTAAGNDIVTSIKRGDIDQMSFAFSTFDPPHSGAPTWQTEDGVDIRELVQVNLFDISVVVFPAYPDTSVQLRSNDPTIALQSLVLHQRRRLADRGRRKRVEEHRAYLDALRS